MIDSHVYEAEAVARDLGVDLLTGLADEEVTARRNQYGRNVIEMRSGPPAWVRLAAQLHQPLIYVLLAAGALTLWLKGPTDAAVIFGVVAINAVVGFLQEGKALKAIEALKRTLAVEATVMRGSQKVRVAAADLVPGDVVMLQSGDKVPADLRLCHVRELRIDESALTGESLPVHKRAEALAQDVPLAERCNMAYSSTLVTYGSGTGVAIAIGGATEIGRLSEMVSEAKNLETPLTRRMRRFSHYLLAAILGLAALSFAVGTLHGLPLLDTLMAAIALAVSAIPEGLPAAITIILAIGVARMARRHAIIRNLPAVETLGATTVICSDKTGTLTQNQMTVQAVWTGGETFQVTGAGYAPAGSFLLAGRAIDPSNAAALMECLRCGALCNDALLFEAAGLWSIQGDPTEAALLSAAGKAGIHGRDLAERFKRIDTLPFESEHQYMATLHRDREAGHARAMIKGAAERLLTKCSAMLDRNGRALPLDEAAARETAQRLAAEGLRVLVMAAKDLPAGHDAVQHADIEGGLTLLGLQAMLDPPRPEAARAVAISRCAGIEVKMITGDNAGTARAIARKLGITGDDKEAVLSGEELSRLSDQALMENAARCSVFARVAPEHKLRLVRALQARGEVVAMTGDGVNDAPALKQADIGVAMGRAGTDAAREAAHMILTDDNFATIEAAVEEGRAVFDNILKFLVWTLPTNIGQALVLVLALVFGTELPILPVQILWVNMATAVLLGIALAFEEKEPGLMDRGPRPLKAPLFSGILLGRMFMVACLLCGMAFWIFEWELQRGAGPAEARTAAVATFVVGQILYLFNCRSLTKAAWSLGWFSNPWIWAGALLMVVLQLVFTYQPTMQAAFHTADLDYAAWIRVTLAALVVGCAVAVEKTLRKPPP